MAGALSHIRILDLARVLAGPLALPSRDHDFIHAVGRFEAYGFHFPVLSSRANPLLSASTR